MWIKFGLKLIFVCLMFMVLIQFEASANPLFFDRLFPVQSTTPESHISDYRGQKRANSQSQVDLNETLSTDNSNNNNAGNAANDQQQQQQQELRQQENRQRNIEFYADLIGKFVGTIRSSITNLVDAIRLNRQKNEKEEQLQHENQDTNEAQQKLQRQEFKLKSNEEQQPTINIQKIVKNKIKTKKHVGNQDERQTTENAIKMQMTISDSVSSINPTTLTPQPDQHLANNNKTSEMKLKSLKQMELNGQHESSLPNEKLNVLIDSRQQSDGDNLPKQKRSDKTTQSLIDEPNYEIGNGNNGSDEPETVGNRKARLLQAFLSFILTPIVTPITETPDTHLDTHAQPKHFINESNSTNRKIFNLNLSINGNNESTDDNTNTNNEGGNLRDTVDNDNKLSLQLLLRSPTKNYEVNSTIISPFQALRLLHQRMHNHTGDLHFRTRKALQDAFYRYVRLYLIARRGYKNAKNSGAGHFEVTENESGSGSGTTEQIPVASARYARLHNDIDFEDMDEDEIIQNVDFLLDDEDMVTNDARVNEAFAILLLEILGAIYALTIGAIAQFQLYYGNS